jgi:hypothetical protein
MNAPSFCNLGGSRKLLVDRFEIGLGRGMRAGARLAIWDPQISRHFPLTTAARDIQLARYADAGLPQVRTNAEAPASVLEEIAKPDVQGQRLPRDAAETMRLSARLSPRAAGGAHARRSR